MFCSSIIIPQDHNFFEDACYLALVLLATCGVTIGFIMLVASLQGDKETNKQLKK